MAHQQQSNNILDAVQLLADHGFDEMSQALQILFNEAMKLERSEYLGAEPYQRSVTRRSYANGLQAEIISKSPRKAGTASAPDTRWRLLSLCTGTRRTE
ncbi:Transposase, Mutator family [Gimesia panareensis]|uniref:Transposase, Mutator family n=1 Tax=Gimesia panareensis TaxID=2527978 RepID=A0A517PZJ4_9PLAN|nr:transposase [Gimesia panareensis]QDT24800.1 Transposase, Mutator family [Gimesia panareensis]